MIPQQYNLTEAAKSNFTYFFGRIDVKKIFDINNEKTIGKFYSQNKEKKAGRSVTIFFN